VTRVGGESLGFGRALLRETVVKQVLMILIVPLLVDWLIPLLPSWKGRSLHDKLVRTEVVSVRRELQGSR
jgi:hypothetical protein